MKSLHRSAVIRSRPVNLSRTVARRPAEVNRPVRRSAAASEPEPAAPALVVGAPAVTAATSAEGAPAADAPTLVEPEVTSSPEVDDTPEETFYEGCGADAELAVSILLGVSLIYLPLTLASIGRRLYFKLKITNKRIIVAFNSPVTNNEIQVAYSQIKEVRSINRAFGAWGDMVIFLNNGKTIDLIGMDKVAEIKAYIEQRIGPFY